jgi:hypothetical protein
MTTALGQRGGMWRRRVLLIPTVLALAGACRASAATPRIATAELLAPSWSGGVIANAAFVPGSDAVDAHAPFVGTLRLTETQMSTQPAALPSPPGLNQDPKLFPGVAISFFTDKGDLVPFTQDVIR